MRSGSMWRSWRRTRAPDFPWRSAEREMMAPVPRIYVTGHRNPDADSIASAIGYAELKSRLDTRNQYVAARLGGSHPQTRWPARRSAARQPRFLPHVMVRACDVMQTSFPIAKAQAP